jgi:SAM-dependent methyltransferase
VNLRETVRRREYEIETADFFPSLEEEIGNYRRWLTGRVLNAGAGDRDVRHLVDGELVNQDIAESLHNTDAIDIFSPLHEIPVPDGHFDAILCNAVLEHVRNPVEVLAEFRRVCRPGGILYLVVPFMQPEHLDPTDFQRYTSEGLQELVHRHDFAVVEVNGVHSVYTTLGWIAKEWLQAVPGWRGWLGRWLILPALKRTAKRSDMYVHSLASAYRVVARRLPNPA